MIISILYILLNTQRRPVNSNIGGFVEHAQAHSIPFKYYDYKSNRLFT